MEPNQQPHNEPDVRLTKPHAEEPRMGDEDGRPITPGGIAIALSVLALSIAGTAGLATYPALSERGSAATSEGQFAAALYASETPTVRAKAAIVYDMSTDTVLFQKSEDAQLPLASLTKVMLALVAVRTLPEDAEVTITKEALAPEGDSGLRVGERWKLQDLIDATLIPSSNDGAQALALASGDGDARKAVAGMNALAREINLAHTYFLNPTGLDESLTQAGAYGSARDMARIFAYALREHPDLLDGTARDGMLLTSDSGIEHTAINTNEALGQIPGLIAGKTGTTDLAGGNLAVAFDSSIGRPVIVIVLGSTESGRFDDIRALVRFARETLQ